MVTNDAIIIINAGILTLLGICDLTRETTIFDINKTNNVATPIPKPLYADDVTPQRRAHTQQHNKYRIVFNDPF